MLTLEVLIATHMPAGLERVAAMALPYTDGVSYIVSWQQHGNAPVPWSLACRDDVTVLRFDGIGVSANRNNAIDHARADIYLNADNDLIYTAAQLQAVRRVFAENPDVDYASFRYEGTAKYYPPSECSLTAAVPKGFYQSSIEIAVRRNARTAALRFNTMFGFGAGYLQAAEDEVFLLTARRMGLNCRYFPIIITRHEGLSTGQRPVSDPGVLRAMGAYLRLAYPVTFIPRILLKARRLAAARRASMGQALTQMCRGAVYICKVRL